MRDFYLDEQGLKLKKKYFILLAFELGLNGQERIEYPDEREVEEIDTEPKRLLPSQNARKLKEDSNYDQPVKLKPSTVDSRKARVLAKSD